MFSGQVASFVIQAAYFVLLARLLGSSQYGVLAGAAALVNIFSQYGNQIAASLPHALHVARRRNLLKKDTHSLLIGSAAGISLAGAVVCW